MQDTPALYSSCGAATLDRAAPDAAKSTPGETLERGDCSGFRRNGLTKRYILVEVAGEIGTTLAENTSRSKNLLLQDQAPAQSIAARIRSVLRKRESFLQGKK
jgi:hypothetical protein